ncbi:hypothetical protein J5X84_15005 [Streptosporangiaceae bacterium NEAU-GS5]|nr:hypothetical protein [Streptosporangiaceae bacterium NEAU-GS5]
MKLRDLVVRSVLPAIVVAAGIGVTGGVAQAGLTNCQIYAGYRSMYYNDWLNDVEYQLAGHDAGDYHTSLYWDTGAEDDYYMYTYYDGRVNACNLREP